MLGAGEVLHSQAQAVKAVDADDTELQAGRLTAYCGWYWSLSPSFVQACPESVSSDPGRGSCRCSGNPASAISSISRAPSTCSG